MLLLSALPTPQELAGLVDYLLNNPALFIHSTTVITATLVAAAIALRVLRTFAYLVGILTERMLRAIAPPLALVLLYFGIGAMALSSEILIRFHASIPATTEEQLRSGVGHLLVGLLGVLALLPWLRGRSSREWLVANLVATAYWTFQVVVLTPPWFALQGQRALVLAVVTVLLAVSATATIVGLGRALRRTPAVAKPDTAGTHAARRAA